jgi:hypothetical protein
VVGQLFPDYMSVHLVSVLCSIVKSRRTNCIIRDAQDVAFVHIKALDASVPGNKRYLFHAPGVICPIRSPVYSGRVSGVGGSRTERRTERCCPEEAGEDEYFELREGFRNEVEGMGK